MSRYPHRPTPRTRTVWLVAALGMGQIVSWGALYYSIAVLGAPMRAELGISEASLFGAYSFSLLLSGLAAPAAGRAIDRFGGRTMMSAGSLVAGLALVAIATAQSTVAVYAAWALAGVAMALTLYEPAFATLSQHTGTSYRKALTALTLLGGLASTVFWPASLLGFEQFGWRTTLLLFAAMELCVCLPLHAAYVPSSRRSEAMSVAGPDVRSEIAPPATMSVRRRRIASIGLATAFALNGFVVSALAVHLIAVLQGKAFRLASAVWVASFIGPMQVAGRIAEFAWGRRHSSRTVGLVSLLTVVAALLLLLMLEGSVAVALVYAVLYGAANGVLTIVRGVVPAELFGRVGYGSTLGNIAAPALIARAIAPLACAGLAEPGAATVTWLIALTVLSVGAAASFAVAITRPSKG